MSSHREAPTISKDPVADNTDLYAFVDPVDTSKVTIVSNFIPLEEPAGGPNFFQFGDDVLYEILIDNNGDGVEDVTYQFRFKTTTQNPGTFLYNTGPIGSLTDPNWNVRQLYSVAKVLGPRRTGSSTLLGSDLPTPPVRIGPRSTPDYASLADAAVNNLGGGVKTFAGQRGEGFYVDLGSIFDLGALRPFQNLHLIPTPAAPGVNGTKGFNVHTIAIQVPKTDLAALTVTGASRADLIAILLTGIPSGIIPGFQNSNGPTQADELRLNLAFAPSYDASDSGINPPGGSAKRFGLLGGDLDGFPDGRRVFDNVTAAELRAIAGVTYPLLDSSFTPDAAARVRLAGAALRFSVALAQRDFHAELHRLFRSRGWAQTLPAMRLRVLKAHKDRCTFEVSLDTENGWQSLIGKVHEGDRSDVFAAMQSIVDAGFGPTAEFAIPRPLTYVPSLHVLLEERIQGTQVKEIFLDGALDERLAAARRCGAWLARYHLGAPQQGRLAAPSESMTDPSTRSLRHMALPDPGTRRGISRFTKPQNVCTGHYATYTNGFLRSPSGPRSCSMKGSARSDGFART